MSLNELLKKKDELEAVLAEIFINIVAVQVTNAYVQIEGYRIE
jgi:hypothetical protein